MQGIVPREGTFQTTSLFRLAWTAFVTPQPIHPRVTAKVSEAESESMVTGLDGARERMGKAYRSTEPH